MERMPNATELRAMASQSEGDPPTKLVFMVYDQAAETFVGEPFFEVTCGTAERAFGHAVMQEGHPFNQHPEDFSLWEVGAYWSNLVEGRPAVAGLAPRRVVTARQILNARKAQE